MYYTKRCRRNGIKHNLKANCFGSKRTAVGTIGEEITASADPIEVLSTASKKAVDLTTEEASTTSKKPVNKTTDEASTVPADPIEVHTAAKKAAADTIEETCTADVMTTEEVSTIAIAGTGEEAEKKTDGSTAEHGVDECTTGQDNDERMQEEIQKVQMNQQWKATTRAHSPTRRSFRKQTKETHAEALTPS